jgi:hypothetical protein
MFFQPDALVANTDVDQVVILFNPDSFTNDTYLFDDIELTNLAEGGFLYDDFDGNTNVEYNFIDGDFATVANPSPDAVNGSANVARFDKAITVGAPIVISHFGIQLMEDITDFVNGTKFMTMDLYYDRAFDFQIRIKLQNGGLAFTGSGDDGVHSIYYAEYNGSGVDNQKWKTLVFVKDNGYAPAPNTSVANIDEVRIEIDYTFAGADTYYIDNIFGPANFNQCLSVVPNTEIFEDAECQRNLAYEFWNGGFGSVPNPVTTGINTSPLALKLVKEEETGITPGDGAFGGKFANNFTFTSDDYFGAKIQLHNPGGNVPGDTLAVVFRDGATDLSYIKIPLTTASLTQWVEYDIDFSFISPSVDIDGFILLFNPHTFTADEVYFDNFMLSNDLSTKSINNTDLMVSPNPSSNFVNIESTNLMVGAIVYDLAGKIVMREDNSGLSSKLNIEILSEGTYIVEILFNDGSTQNRKIIKN